ncbi:MAG: hypothetical protein GTO03_07200 [Planctomycetales bacterium]|nr:hypothetical protein [Planctomycetales bacterium]
MRKCYLLLLSVAVIGGLNLDASSALSWEGRWTSGRAGEGPVRADTLGSRKTVTVHLADSAGEAMAKAERSNPGWKAVDAREVGNRVWQVVMVKD